MSPKTVIHVETRDVVSQESRGKLPSLVLGERPNSPVEALLIPQFTVICTCAMFEPGFQIVVTLSVTCGTERPAETDWIQKMEFESDALKYFTITSVFLQRCTELNLFRGSNSPRTLVQFFTSFPGDGWRVQFPLLSKFFLLINLEFKKYHSRWTFSTG